jgi:hypothetical protein
VGADGAQPRRDRLQNVGPLTGRACALRWAPTAVEGGAHPWGVGGGGQPLPETAMIVCVWHVLCGAAASCCDSTPSRCPTIQPKRLGS